MTENKILMIVLSLILVLGISFTLFCCERKASYPQETFPVITDPLIEETTESIFIPSPEPPTTIPVETEATTIPTETTTIPEESTLTESTLMTTITSAPIEPTEEDVPLTEPTTSSGAEENNSAVDISLAGFDPYEVAPNKMTNRELLACVVYQEAGWSKSCDECRKMIADVILNRVASQYFPNTIYEVLIQDGQYGEYSWTDVKWPPKAANDVAGRQRAYDAVDAIIRGEHSALYGTDYWWQIETQPLGSDIIYCCGTYYGRGALA